MIYIKFLNYYKALNKNQMKSWACIKSEKQYFQKDLSVRQYYR